MSTVMQDTPPKEEYRAPVVGVGDSILWFPEGKASAEPYAATVVKLIPNSRYIEIWIPDQHQRKRRVRHMTDPELQRQTAVTRRDGGWDHTEFNKAVIKMLGKAAPRRAPDPPKPGNLTPLSELVPPAGQTETK